MRDIAQFTVFQGRRIIEAVKWFEAHGRIMLADAVKRLPFRRVKMQVVAVSGSFPAFAYTMQPTVGYDSSQTAFAKWLLGGGTITGAVNRLEWSGSPPYTYGNGLTITSSSGQVNSGSCVIVSAPVGATLLTDFDLDASTGSLTLSFEYPNSAQ